MEILVVTVIVIALVYWAFKTGKQEGSQKGLRRRPSP